MNRCQSWRGWQPKSQGGREEACERGISNEAFSSNVLRTLQYGPSPYDPLPSLQWILHDPLTLLTWRNQSYRTRGWEYCSRQRYTEFLLAENSLSTPSLSKGKYSEIINLRESWSSTWLGHWLLWWNNQVRQQAIDRVKIHTQPTISLSELGEGKLSCKPQLCYLLRLKLVQLGLN